MDCIKDSSSSSSSSSSSNSSSSFIFSSSSNSDIEAGLRFARASPRYRRRKIGWEEALGKERALRKRNKEHRRRSQDMLDFRDGGIKKLLMRQDPKGSRRRDFVHGRIPVAEDDEEAGDAHLPSTSFRTHTVPKERICFPKERIAVVMQRACA